MFSYVRTVRERICLKIPDIQRVCTENFRLISFKSNLAVCVPMPHSERFFLRIPEIRRVCAQSFRCSTHVFCKFLKISDDKLFFLLKLSRVNCFCLQFPVFNFYFPGKFKIWRVFVLMHHSEWFGRKIPEIHGLVIENYFCIENSFCIE